MLFATLLFTAPVPAEPVAVRFQEGSVHGFLSLRASDGKLLASGDLTQMVHGNLVVSRLVFHFKDGSVDDEKTTFSQRGVFRLLSDHHIQRGPSFPKPIDVLINAVTGNVTVRYKDKERQKVETNHVDLPPDVANGVILNILKDIPPTQKETKLSYVAATPKPRLVKLFITPEGEESFSAAGASHKAVRFKIKVELGGLVGMIVPLIGKQPADVNVWITAGEAPPAFVKSEGPQYEGGPNWTIEMTSPVWPRAQK